MAAIKISLLLVTLLGFTSCVTPDQWSANDHRKTMNQCRQMCQKRVKSYEPMTGECRCYAPVKEPKDGE